MNAENNTRMAMYITLIIAVAIIIIELLSYIAWVDEINRYNVMALMIVMLTTAVLTAITQAILNTIYALFGIRNTLKDVRKGLMMNRNNTK